jgi:hypothetical protein
MPSPEARASKESEIYMDDFLGIITFRMISRSIGLYTRYFFFRLIGNKRSLKSLSYKSKNEYKDLGKELNQDFLNALIGTIISLLIILVMVAIIFS